MRDWKAPNRRARSSRKDLPGRLEPSLPRPPSQRVRSKGGTRKRDAREWVSLLEELSAQLARGQLYSRDLPAIDGQLREVVDHYMRRVEERRR